MKHLFWLKGKKKSNSFIFNLWWTEIEKYSRRDQISLTYILRNNKLKIGIILGSREENEFSVFNRHLYSEYKFANFNDQDYSKIKSLIFKIIISIYYYLR